jgi:hypothetical protein
MMQLDHFWLRRAGEDLRSVAYYLRAACRALYSSTWRMRQRHPKTCGNSACGLCVPLPPYATPNRSEIKEWE